MMGEQYVGIIGGALYYFFYSFTKSMRAWNLQYEYYLTLFNQRD